MEVTVILRSNLLTALLATALLLGASGCRLPKRFGDTNITPTPVLLPEQPTFEDVARVVNANSAAVKQIQVSNAKLRSPAIPMSLKAKFALDKPRQFRLTAESIRGNELDLGSNNNEYWIWVNDRRAALYHGRHDRFYQSAARNILPVPPHWLIEAIGLVEFDMTGRHEGPIEGGPGKLEIRSLIGTPTGDLEKVTVIDSRYGWVLEQRVYDASRNNELLALAIGSDFEYYAAHGVSLPRNIEIKLPPANLEFSIEVERHVINQLYADPDFLWTLPYDIGNEQVDLERMSNPEPQYVEPNESYRPSTAHREPTYRRRYEDDGYLPPRQALRRLPPSENAYRYR